MKSIAVLVVFFVILLGSNFAYAQEAPGFFSPMTFTFEQTDMRRLHMGLMQIIYAKGAITPGTVDNFLTFASRNKVSAGAYIYFDSPGGSLNEGMELGRIIRSGQLNTEVGVQGRDTGGECYSSCTLAFLGGVWRDVQSTAQFGVHQFSSSENLSGLEALNVSQQESGKVIDYITSMGVSPEFFVDMSTADPSHVDILSQDSLRSLNVITPDYTTVWDLRPSSAGVYVRATTTNIRGTHKFLFACPAAQEPYPILFALIEADQSSQDVVNMTANINLVFDGKEVPISRSEIAEMPSVSRNDVAVALFLTPRLIDLLQNAKTLGIELVPLSRMIFFGFSANLGGGKDELFTFLNACGRQ